MNYDPAWEQRAVSPAEVVTHVKSGQRVFVHGAAATPTELLAALDARRELTELSLYHIHLAGPCPFAEPSGSPGIFSNSMFIGPGLRKALEAGRADFIPVFLSDIPALFASGAVPLDVALVQLSPPDKHGNCTLGTSLDCARAAVDSARIVLAVVNRQMPRTHGHTVVPLRRVTAFTVVDRPLYEAPPAEQGPVESRIGELIAGLVDDGATLQMGIGAIPDAVLARLGNKHELGVHSEMFSDGLIPLIEGGVITNRQKAVHPGRIVTAFVSGSARLFRFVDDNQQVEFHPCDRTNDTALIRKNPKVCAINSALALDLSGQVCADSMGTTMFSGIGGQMDFIRGAALSHGGKPIIALPSTAKNGQVSRISTTLAPGSGVVTTRGHVHYVATEYGVVNLHGLNLRQRADALIGIAHPDFRAELRREICQLRHYPL